ncbi:hypothetical protein K2173_003631 [Erythroxylum novogranatense]|uniref:Fanconi-associated nuclease n=1 Tax=Erythroxylum novogranatense TaxID=1862640 RepID=A0AAV8TBY2_9ROSI|nr:hypothetical protein K2173_003631 [Erythroxylum novogranatense]
MLNGRESLIRLVGKRRRFLPNRGSLLSTPISDEKCNLVESKVDGFKARENEEYVWVTCPVCGGRFRSEDDVMNSHLDACLSRRTKRKMTQRTLLNFNFTSQSLLPSSFCEIENNLVDDNDSSFCKIPLNRQTGLQGTLDGSNEELVDVDLSICRVGPSSLPLENEVTNCDVPMNVDAVTGVTLATFIVGRKFSCEKDLNTGEKICLLRDPNNAKDPNAIKVLSADSRCCKELGFLPRELAQFLSPMIDMYTLTFEGYVTSIPKHSFGAVPIQIVCCKVMAFDQKDSGGIEAFRFLWKNVIRVVESKNSYSPSTIRYQQNFCLLIEEVFKTNHHLFSNDDKSFMESFFSLPDDSQRLFVRLYTRKGPWFRMSSLSYPEILNFEQAIKELFEKGYACYFENSNGIQSNDIKEILDMLTLSELREIVSMIKSCTRGTRKQDLVASLFSCYEAGVCPFLCDAILKRTGSCVKISSKAESVVWRAERLFFLNGQQDLSAFLLVDLGIVKFPAYKCTITEPIFSSRSDLLAYEEAIEVAQVMDESLDKRNSESVLKCIEIANSRIPSFTPKASHSAPYELRPTFFSCFSATWVYSKVIFLGVSFLECERRYNEAVDLLKKLLDCFPCDGRRGNWILRLSIDLEHLGRQNESLSVAEEGLLDQWVRAGSRMALQRRVLRLGKPPRRWKVPSFANLVKRKIKEVHIKGRPLNSEAGLKSLFCGEDDKLCGVEQLALQYYAREGGWIGVHTESGIWLTIFALLMWDIIFSDVHNVFFNRFQTAPLDLETDNFYSARKSLIESHLQKIHDGMAEELIILSWEIHLGTACRGVNWDRHSLTELRAAVSCIGGPCLALLCRNLAQDYGSWSSGMPDLLLWRFHGEHGGEAKLVEVKGPRDHLSEQQRAWLLLLMDCGFNAEVFKVRTS